MIGLQSFKELKSQANIEEAITFKSSITFINGAEDKLLGFLAILFHEEDKIATSLKTLHA